MNTTSLNTLKYIDDSILLHNCTIELPVMSELVSHIEHSLHLDENIYIIYADIFCGSAAVEATLNQALQQQLHSTAIILETLSYGHYVSNNKELPCDLLCNLEHGLWTVGNTEALFIRLARYLIFLSLKSNKTHIILIVKAAQNLHQDSLNFLLKLVHKLNEEHVKLFLVLVGETLELSELISHYPFYEYGMNQPNSYRLTPIKSDGLFESILKQFDVCLMGKCFPTAYKEGYRLCNDRQILFEAFRNASAETAAVFIGIPYEILLDTIYTCIRLKGREGESKYWPSVEDWAECIRYTSYQRYIQKVNLSY